MKFSLLKQNYRQARGKKLNYHIGNWFDNNKALVQRGSISLWFSDEAIKG
ncbi:hypothetical protein NEOC65_000016 [Neochlamydia sp. AcF65]|nr:hypothetical protein [Neochlamydia sp. AcF65]